MTQATLANWQSIAGKDLHSLAGVPLFLDINGADNVLGGVSSPLGDGKDDNFGLKRGSPAIDAANAYVAPVFDAEERPRRDDTATVNTGIGWDLFVEGNTGSNSFTAVGTTKNFMTTSGAVTQILPFAFPFYGKTYNSVQISVNGFLHFEGPDGASSADANSLDGLIRNVRIAPLWDDLTTGPVGKDIFVDTSVANQVTIRWAAARQDTGGGDVNVSVVLFANGSFRFDYGTGNTNLTPTIGVSAGNERTYVLSRYDQQATLATVESVQWQPQPGLTYVDIGAYEFLGRSDDAAAPLVGSILNLPASGGTTDLGFSEMVIEFNEPLEPLSARSPANYILLEAGADDTFDTPDDQRIAVQPVYSFPQTFVTLQLPGGPLPEGLYRLTLSGTNTIYDASGNPLDGTGSGTGGQNFVYSFTIDRSANLAPTATVQSVTATEDTPRAITLSGSDPNSDSLAFSLLTQPAHGTLSLLNPVTGTVTYTPQANYSGLDQFTFQVNDGKLGTADAVVSLTVTPVNDPPVGVTQSVTGVEDQPTLVMLAGTDFETLNYALTFNLVTAPVYGSLMFAAAGVWTYLPDLNFFGTDQFVCSVTDGGEPVGAAGTALTSAPQTVTVTVMPGADAPVITAAPDRSVDFGTAISFRATAFDPDGPSDTLRFQFGSSAPSGASLDPVSGQFSWTPTEAQAPGIYRINLKVTDSIGLIDTTSFVVFVTIPQVGTIRGTLFEDLNGDGQRTAGEPGVVGLTVFVDLDSDGSLDLNEQRISTDGTGAYVLNGVTPGSFRVLAALPSGWVSTAPATGGHNIVLASGETISGRDFGVFKLGEIRGVAFDDIDVDAQQDINEPALSVRTIYLDANGNGLRDTGERSAVTDATGAYQITALGPGSYRVAQELPARWLAAAPASTSHTVMMSSGFLASARDFGAVLLTYDIDRNGQADALSDGIVFIRYLFGFTDTALSSGVVDPVGSRTDPRDIVAYLDRARSAMLDVDGNGQADALSDGIVIVRYLFGFTGDALINGVIDPNGTRNTATAVEAFLSGFLPVSSPSVQTQSLVASEPVVPASSTTTVTTTASASTVESQPVVDLTTESTSSTTNERTSIENYSFAYVQRLWVKDYVAPTADVTADDEELLIQLA